MADQNDDGEDDWFERAVRGEDTDDEEETSAEDREEPVTESTTDSGVQPDESVPGTDAGTPPDTDTGQSDQFGFDIDDDSVGQDAADAFAQASGTPDTPEGFDLDDGGGESFGFDMGGGGQEPETFDDEDLESDIPRIDLGIEGLDQMIQGGVPERSLLVAIGGAGTGKTTFGLQFLHEALASGERGVYITLEESHGRVIQSAEEKGWAFERFEERDDLAIIDLDPIEMANSLTSIRNELPRLVEAFGASRLVLDSVSLLEMMYDDQATRRTEIYDFARSLKRAGVTTMLTSEADAENPFASRYGLIEYLTDAVFVLRHVRPDDFRETRLAIEIQKIRDANHSRETKPYDITDSGISVYQQANIF